ncbi:MAG: hypothetical protein KatS3mg112_1140 [Thermogutta sp.]|nr:MAG: hypothetical protein KatS3mg112_1140 [Thermogutta sp.]
MECGALAPLSARDFSPRGQAIWMTQRQTTDPTSGSLHCTHWRPRFQPNRLRSFILFMGWIAAPGAIRANGTVVKAKAFTGKRR